MSKSAAIVVSIAMLASPAVRAQDAGDAAPQIAEVPADAVWAPRTGDDWLDTWLADMNRYAARHHDAFVDEIVRYQGAPRALVEELLVEQRWQPADVYLACATALALGRACREVATERRRDAAGGWDEALARLDAGAGSAPLRRVRQGVVASYDRWARPITLDAQLRRALPERGGG
ncbi:hypothetical protein LDO26_02740 [Luteimonas sp. BDR2-5]|uniref:hypothetical protein n=1 Tax=Proluteimonas luteida TaxID=2878685 RepID=UPI001E4F9F62|nr:hypothetical protein [Luteimonas sp. BDR2-5]MCD9027131.1 hypothetical protein [Luteimonas sp. BDR2-5]